ncbi:MAG: hypothetical protein EHM43_08775 [Ignavibacteriae bacterium]|nr:MAG: hypothetical protein EHM43_08775 [Ignavibacteriota bacterium]
MKVKSINIAIVIATLSLIVSLWAIVNTSVSIKYECEDLTWRKNQLSAEQIRMSVENCEQLSFDQQLFGLSAAVSAVFVLLGFAARVTVLRRTT